jgi:hypothetical protein
MSGEELSEENENEVEEAREEEMGEIRSLQYCCNVD